MNKKECHGEISLFNMCAYVSYFYQICVVESRTLVKKFMTSNEPSVIKGIICFCVSSETPNKNECHQFYLNCH